MIAENAANDHMEGDERVSNMQFKNAFYQRTFTGLSEKLAG